MSDLELLGFVAAALSGGVVGAAIVMVLRLSFAQPAATRPTSTSSRSWNDRLDPNLNDRVRDLSEEWAKQHGRPEASFLAAGYLQDAAEDLQRRWRDFR